LAVTDFEGNTLRDLARSSVSPFNGARRPALRKVQRRIIELDLELDGLTPKRMKGPEKRWKTPPRVLIFPPFRQCGI